VNAKAFIFDLDGTILDTLPDLADSLDAALTAVGLPAIPLEKYKIMVGDGLLKLIERALPDERRAELAEATRLRFKAEYARRRCARTVPCPGLPEVLAALAARGRRLGVLTNKDHDDAQTIVEHYYPGRFQAVLGAAAGRPPKPDPTGALELAGLLGATPAEVVYVGDSGVDMTLGLRAGFRPVGAAWGYRSAAELEASGAFAVVAAPTDLLKFLAS
jgi:phosphoglycolate phosphatase